MHRETLLPHPQALSVTQNNYSNDPTALQHANPLIFLTQRERQILALIDQGLTSKSMGELLGLSPRTIERHRANLRQKFQKTNTVSLLHTARHQGLL